MSILYAGDCSQTAYVRQTWNCLVKIWTIMLECDMFIFLRFYLIMSCRAKLPSCAISVAIILNTVVTDQ